MFGLFKKKEPPSKPPERFPPVPDWQPKFGQPIEKIVDRVRHYSNGTRDFAVFENGTVSILPDDLSDQEASAHALEALHKVFHAHVDMKPLPMKDGNFLVHYNHDVASVVLEEVIQEHWDEIQQKHLQALATHEVLITPLGHNVFDDLGKKVLFGRCYMFMDAQSPKVIHVVRKSI